LGQEALRLPLELLQQVVMVEILHFQPLHQMVVVAVLELILLRGQQEIMVGLEEVGNKAGQVEPETLLQLPQVKEATVVEVVVLAPVLVAAGVAGHLLPVLLALQLMAVQVAMELPHQSPAAV
jgi:hypothetical protein